MMGSVCCCLCTKPEPGLADQGCQIDQSLPPPTPKIYSWDSRPKAQDHRIQHEENAEIIRTPGSINGEQIVIEACKDSRIYLLDYIAAVNIDDCEGCIVVTGPVSGSVFLRDSKNCTLCTASGQLRLRDCSSIHLFCSSESEPIIENSEFIRIASYSLSYKGIPEHFRATSLCPEKLLSNSIYDFTPPMLDSHSNWKSIQGADPTKFISPPICAEDLEFGLEAFHMITPLPPHKLPYSAARQ